MVVSMLVIKRIKLYEETEKVTLVLDAPCFVMKINPCGVPVVTTNLFYGKGKLKFLFNNFGTYF